MVWRKIEVDGNVYHIGKMQYAVLRMISERGSVRPEEVWARFGFMYKVLISSVEKMIDNNLVYRDNGRLFMTELGQKVLENAMKFFEEGYVNNFEGWR